MILDAQNRFSNEQTVTTGSDSGVFSTDKIDLGSERKIGAGENLYVVVVCDKAMTSSGNNDTLTVDLYSDTATAFDSPTFKQNIGVFPAASPAGTRIVARINPDVLNERFIGLRYLAASDPLTQGDFSAYIVKDIDAHHAFPDAIHIS